jgi:azurin
MFYTARAFPQAYWNHIAFVNEPTMHITGQVAIESQGAGYAARDAWNLLAGAEEWFAPVVSEVGPDGAVWVSDWYNFIAQHNPTPANYSVGRGAAYETSMRDHIRGRIYRVVYKGAPPQKRRSLSRADTAGLLEALASDNQLWRLQAQRLIVERGQKDVVPQLIAMARNTAVDAIGTNGGAMHALWTLKGLGELETPTTEAYRAAVEDLKHPAAGVRKAAAMVLPRTAEAASAMLAAATLDDPDLHTRLAATLVLSEMPSSAAVAQAILKASRQPDNYGDPWLGRALYIAANRHQAEFLAAYTAAPNPMPFAELSVPLRLGTLKPDWRAPAAADLASWKDMTLPGAWETRGLPNFDGAVWFTRTVDLPAGQPPAELSLGAVRNNAEVWINGVSLTPQTAGGRGQGGAPLPGLPVAPTATARFATISYPVPANTMRTGANVITVRVDNSRGDGGFVGQPADMYLQAGQTRTPLAGTWKYRVERSANIGAIYSSAGELAAHVAFTAAGGANSAAAAALPSVAQAPDVVVQLGTVENQMKYSATEITVQPNQLVEIVFTNSDSVQHNFVLGQPGSLETIGLAADAFAREASAPAQSYVPDVAQVIVKTPLVNAGQSTRFQFRAPAAPGQYPYLCTFPGHWRMMNGVLNVVQFGRGRGAGGAGAPPAGRGAAGQGAGRGRGN